MGKNIFDMESDGQEFHIFVPSKNQFSWVRRIWSDSQPSRLRISGLSTWWMRFSGSQLPAADPVLLEETSDQSGSYYVLIVAQRSASGPRNGGAAAMGDWELARKIWFDRKDLSIARECRSMKPAGY